MSVITPNLAAPGQTVWVYIGAPKILAILEPHPIGTGTQLTPEKSCFSLTCVTMPQLVILGQTVRA